MNVIKLGANTLLDPLLKASRAEGFKFVSRLQLERSAGAFDKPGTALFSKFIGAELVGVGGLTPDPYPDAEPDTGRLRHLYVLPHYRRQGIGKRLVTAILWEARRHYCRLRLRTDTPEAARSYETLGFTAITEPDATHFLALG